MKIKVFVSESSSSSKTGIQLAMQMVRKFAIDKALDTKNEFTTKVTAAHKYPAQIDGPNKGIRSKAVVIGTYYIGKSLVGNIVYPLNAIVYIRDTKKAYLVEDRKFVKEIPVKTFAEAAFALEEFVIVGISNYEEHINNILKFS